MAVTQSSNTVFDKAYGGTAPEIYQRVFVPAIGQPFAIDLIALAGIRTGQRVLDVACGTGVVARLAAERVGPTGSVSGADISPAMLDVARSSSAGTQPAIAWYETAAEAMPISDASFDVVLSQFGLQFMTDKHAALGEMRRALVPGGRVVVSVPTPTPFFDVMHDAIERHVGKDAASFVHVVFSVNDAGNLQHLLESAGFHEATVQHHSRELHLPPAAEFLWQYVQSTPLGPLVMGVDENRRAGLERDVVTGWQPWTTGRGMTYRQDILVASGRR